MEVGTGDMGVTCSAISSEISHFPYSVGSIQVVGFSGSLLIFPFLLLLPYRQVLLQRLMRCYFLLILQ